MAVTHPTLMRNVLADAVVDLLNSGFVVFQTSTGGQVARCTFNATAFGAAATGQAVANQITSDTSADGGITTKAELRTSASVAKVLCSVTSTSGGGDIQLGSTTISAGQTVSISSLRYQAPA